MDVEHTLGGARVAFREDRLAASTGEMRREWRWTGYGFVTVALENLVSGRSWCQVQPAHACDWVLPGLDTHDVPVLHWRTLRLDRQTQLGREASRRALCAGD